MRHTVAAVISTFIFLGCASAPAPSPPRSAGAPAARNLSVFLYPYIPDAANDGFATLVNWLESNFEAQNPDIDVAITMNPAIDPYDPAVQAQLFSASGPNAVETDMITLGDLVANGYVAPLTFTQPTFAFAQTASNISGTTYGIPTWVCMYFFSFGPQGASPNASPRALQRPLPSTGGTPSAWVNGVWNGTWTLPALYLVSTANFLGYGSVQGAMQLPLNASVVSQLTEVMSKCSVNDTNNCLNGTFKYGAPNAAPLAFVQGQYTNTTGFSENTFYILSNGGTRPAIVQPMLLAYDGSNSPLAWTDALTVNRNSCTGQCVADVYTFAQFLNSNQTRIYICFSGDAPTGTPPRYLSPAVNSFYQQAVVQNDPLYPQFQSGFGTAQNFPSQGYPEVKDALNTALCNALRSAIPDACAATARPSRPPGAAYP